ncbi:hypothetical protein J6590_021397 [Homalodisca vitripennis]|nr:hypothetical protein J6590_021397 [Homalodisca vitripennis]
MMESSLSTLRNRTHYRFSSAVYHSSSLSSAARGTIFLPFPVLTSVVLFGFRRRPRLWSISPSSFVPPLHDTVRRLLTITSHAPVSNMVKWAKAIIVGSQCPAHLLSDKVYLWWGSVKA